MAGAYCEGDPIVRANCFGYRVTCSGCGFDEGFEFASKGLDAYQHHRWRPKMKPVRNRCTPTWVESIGEALERGYCGL